MHHQDTGPKDRRMRGGLGSLLVLLTACAGFAGPAAAQGATSPAVTTPTGNPYRACNDGTSNEDHATCMKEAAAAKAEAQRGELTNDDGDFRRNALARCDALPGDQREACRLRILGAGTTSGSVAGGGIVREVVTQTPTREAGAQHAQPMPSTTTGATGSNGNNDSNGSGTTMQGAGDGRGAGQR